MYTEAYLVHNFNIQTIIYHKADAQTKLEYNIGTFE